MKEEKKEVEKKHQDFYFFKHINFKNRKLKITF